MTEDVQSRKLVVICCICKKNKRSVNCWEEFVGEPVADVQNIYSHGLCPECMVSELQKNGIIIDKTELPG